MNTHRIVLLLAALLGLAAGIAALGAADNIPTGRVEALLGEMTLEEKIDLLGGVDDMDIPGVPRLDIPRIRMTDGPLGVASDGPSPLYPGGVALAATWNPELAAEVGREIARDARSRGRHILLAPGVNLQRLALCGRSFEYFGEDPFLVSRITVGYIRGVQSQGVCATVKHFAANNSEAWRNSTDSRVDPRTLRELYLPAFEAAVKDAEVGAVMSSYNKVNGEWMSQNAALNRDLLRGEWGFRGLLISDWISTYDGVKAARAGLDIEMPSAARMNRETLIPAIRDGRLPVGVIDEKARRILTTALRFGWLDRPAADPSIPRDNPAGREIARRAARESIVLLKNAGPVLPLDRGSLRSVLVVGPNAHPAILGGGGSSEVATFPCPSLHEAMTTAVGPSTKVELDPGIPSFLDRVRATRFRTDAQGGVDGLRAEYFATAELAGTPVLARIEPAIDIGSPERPRFPEGTNSERWHGQFLAARAGRHVLAVATFGDGADSFRIWVGDRLVADRWEKPARTLETFDLELEAGPHPVRIEHRSRGKWGQYIQRLQVAAFQPDEGISARARKLAAEVDAVVVAVGFDRTSESEASDRSFALPPGQEELILAMAAANPRTIVVVNSGSACATEAWLPRVPALVQAWYPGFEGNPALAEILLGQTNPSGRLPATFERHIEDNPAFAHFFADPATLRLDYREGVFVGYRGFQQQRISPLFPFGFGLSYTTFAFSELTIEPIAATTGVVRVHFSVTNTGRRAGATVAQVYVGAPDAVVPRPPRELKGFSKVELAPGETRPVVVEIGPRAFCHWDEAAHAWRAAPGRFAIQVGSSCEDLPLRTSFSLTAPFSLRP